jgi:hypothetical protein
MVVPARPAREMPAEHPAMTIQAAVPPAVVVAGPVKPDKAAAPM